MVREGDSLQGDTERGDTHLLPTPSLTPSSFLPSFLLSFFPLLARYFQPVLDYATVHARGAHVVLTGHSLGGGLAKIVGALTGHASVAFSPPGISQTLDTRLRALGRREHPGMAYHRSISVIPENDPVTLVDSQAGLIQRKQST